MRCHICDKQEDLHYDQNTGKFLPCLECREGVVEALDEFEEDEEGVIYHHDGAEL